MDEISRAVLDKEALANYEVRLRDWDGCFIRNFPAERTSIFGLDKELFEETYTVWSAPDQEPQFVTYLGMNESVYSNFERYLDHLTEAAAE